MGGQGESAQFQLQEPTAVPGMFESWYEIAATVGIFSVPIGLLVNLLSSWIWSGFERRRMDGIDVHLTMRRDGSEVEMDLTDIDLPCLKELIEMGLCDDDKCK